MMRLTQSLLAGISLGVLAACASVGPAPKLAPGDVPQGFEQRAAENAPIWPQPGWWRAFDSDELNQLIASAQNGNLDLAQATARLVEADARVRETGASLLPSVNASAGAAKQLHSEGSTLALSASYELDFWGRNHDLVNSARAADKASQADLETVALTATASTASTYFELLSLRERLEIARLNLENAQAILTVTEARVREGIATPLELAQQQAQIAGQQAAIPPLEQQELQTRAALALLLGRPAEGFDVTAQNLDQIALPEVAPGLPAELLVRRPDVVRAEANLQSANANLAAARAAFFPTISLTGTAGASSRDLLGLIDNSFGAYSLGLSIVQSVFDAGLRQAQSDEARAHQDELLAAYRSAAIAAFSDVETSLGAIRHIADQQAYLEEQVTQSQQAFDIAQTRYREGVADYLTVLDAQRTLYGARDQLGVTKRQRLEAIVALYKALGGGWTDPAPGSITNK
jgi:NodT family efflux transporter outer membrane factor (OMF) lipoprotein